MVSFRLRVHQKPAHKKPSKMLQTGRAARTPLSNCMSPPPVGSKTHSQPSSADAGVCAIPRNSKYRCSTSCKGVFDRDRQVGWWLPDRYPSLAKLPALKPSSTESLDDALVKNWASKCLLLNGQTPVARSLFRVELRMRKENLDRHRSGPHES